MNRTLKIFVVLATALGIPLDVRAGPAPVWTLPSNVRIVQRDGIDNVRTFARLDQALASIMDASATKPYVVRVMPGWYGDYCGEGTPYVSIEGSGASHTTICLGSVTHAAVKDVTLAQAGGLWLYAGAILERAVVQANYGVAIYLDTGDANDAQIIDSTIQTTVAATYPSPVYGIFETRGGFKLIRSKVIGRDIGIALAWGNAAPFPVDVIDSDVEAGVSAIQFGANPWITIRGSSLTAQSILFLDGSPSGYLVSAATSKLDGSIAGFTQGATKIVHCYDGALNAIPNL